MSATTSLGTQSLLAVVADTEMKRLDVAEKYAAELHTPGVDWPTVNRAIIDRWSISGLGYIKDRAWSIAAGRVL